MQPLYVLFFLFTFTFYAQKSVGKTDGAEIIKYKDKHEIIFKTQKGNFTSLYIDKNSTGEDGYKVLKRYIFLLFQKKKKIIIYFNLKTTVCCLFIKTISLG